MEVKLPALHNRVDGERDVDQEEEGAKWLARAFRAKNSAFSSEEIWKEIFSF